MTTLIRTAQNKQRGRQFDMPALRETSVKDFEMSHQLS